MSGLTVVITGGRYFENRNAVEAAIHVLDPKYIFVGDCPTGADLFAREYADARGVKLQVFKAEWERFGKRAGPLRNRAMLDAAGSCALVLAFPGGRGTADCIRAAKEIDRVVVRWEP